MAEYYPHLGKETDIQIQKAQKVLNKMNPKRPTPIYIINNMSKIKDKKGNFKEARERHLLSYKGTPIRLSAYFPADKLYKRVA